MKVSEVLLKADAIGDGYRLVRCDDDTYCLVVGNIRARLGDVLPEPISIDPQSPPLTSGVIQYSSYYDAEIGWRYLALSLDIFGRRGSRDLLDLVEEAE